MDDTSVVCVDIVGEVDESSLDPETSFGEWVVCLGAVVPDKQRDDT